MWRRGGEGGREEENEGGMGEGREREGEEEGREGCRREGEREGKEEKEEGREG